MEGVIHDNSIDRYFDSVEDLTDYVFGCYPIEFNLDMRGIIKSELDDNHYEDAFLDISDESISKLQSFVDEWTKSQGIISYNVDYEIVIVLNK